MRFRCFNWRKYHVRFRLWPLCSLGLNKAGVRSVTFVIGYAWRDA